MSIFDRDYEEVGSQDKGLILKTAGKIKIQWGKKFIDLLDSDGNINVKVKSLIQEEQSKEDIKQDGFYLIDGNLVAKFGDQVLELTSKTDVSFVSFLVEQAASSSEKYTALQNIGFLYKNLEDVNVYPTNGIIYVEESQTLFIIKDGVLSKYYASIPNPYTEQFVIAKEDSSEGALIIEGEGSQNSLKFDSLKIYSNYNQAVLEANTGFQFNLSNMKVATINLSGLSVDRVQSIGASDQIGYRLYKSGNSSTLEVGNIQAREDIETNRVHSPNSTNTYGFDLYQDGNESYLKVDNVEARKEVKTDKVYSSDSTNGFILEQITENNITSSSLIANLIKARTEVESDSVHSSNFSNNSGYSLEESVGGSLLTIDNIIAREDVQTESVHSENADEDTGYQITLKNNKYVLDIDKINERIIDEYYDDELYSRRYIITKFDIGNNNVDIEVNIKDNGIENNSIVEVPVRVINNNIEEIVRFRLTLNETNQKFYFIDENNDTLTPSVNNNILTLSYNGTDTTYSFLEETVEKAFLRRTLYVVKDSASKFRFDFKNQEISLMSGTDEEVHLRIGDLDNNKKGLYSDNNVFIGAEFRPIITYDQNNQEELPLNASNFPKYSLQLYNRIPADIDEKTILPIGKIKELLYNPIEDLTVNNKTVYYTWNYPNYYVYKANCDSFYDGKIYLFKVLNSQSTYLDSKVKIQFKTGVNQNNIIQYSQPYTIYNDDNTEATISDLLDPVLIIYKDGQLKVYNSPSITSSLQAYIENLAQQIDYINNYLNDPDWDIQGWNTVKDIILGQDPEQDAQHIIDRWNELVAFLAGISDDDQSTLLGLLNAKSDKATTVTNVGYSNNKLTQTINGTTTDIVSASTIVTDGGAIKTIQIGGISQTVTNNTVNLPAYPTLVDLMTSSSIGSSTKPVYWNGSAWVETNLVNLMGAQKGNATTPIYWSGTEWVNCNSIPSVTDFATELLVGSGANADKIGLKTGANPSGTSFITVPYATNANTLNGHADSYFVTTSTAQEITGKKTFKGSQVLDFKQSAATDKPSFTVYNSSSKEIGCFQYRPDSVNGAALMYLGHYNANPTTVDQTYVGFRSYTAANASQGFSTAAAYNLVSPLPRDAQATFNLTATYQTFYLPLGFKSGTTIIKTDSTGIVDLSSIVSSFSGDYNDLTNKPTLFSGSYNDLTNKPTIPTALSQLSDDSTHRLVTDTEKTTWNNKGTYSKPSGGIPKTDLASSVQTSLGKADTALQSYTETDPIFTASAAYGITSSNISSWNAKGTYSKPSGGIPKTDLSSAVQTSLGKADTALQSYTESDPIFVASAAYGITSTDISNWNSKTSNSGTVTSITIKATSPIAIDSSSAITTSGTRTLSHANSGITAGTYRSVTVNATGHVTAGTNPTTLSGYGITDAKIANGVITLGSNTITPLTSFTETDPVFSASAAAGISSSDITNWNGKTSNTGTVTSVATGVGLTGGSVTTSGTIKAKLKNETANTADSARSTSTDGGLYSVEVDKSGYLAVRVPWKNTTYTVNNATYTVKTKVGSTTTSVSDFTANQSSADDVTFIQGTNVTLTPDTTNRTITIAATDTTYSSKTAASGGTDVSLVTTGEKYTWNNKSTLAIGTTASTAAAGNHTHTLSIAADSGTNDLTLAHGTKYKLTAGGSTFIFTMPASGNTDTKVTSVDNHYAPTANANSELTASLSGTAGTYAKDTEYTVLTGVKAQRDAKGHITGLTYTAQKIKDTNTTYTVSNGTFTIKSKSGDTTTSVSDFTANQSSADDITFIQGSNITLTPDTTNRTITIAATDTNTDTKVTVSNTNPTSGAWYYPTWYSSTSGTGGVSVNDGLRHYSLQGTASAVGRTILQLGNGTASGTAGNKYGEIRIYSKSSNYSAIISADTTTAREHILPATAGTILNTGTTSFTQVLSSGTKIGTIKINGTSTDIYCETNTNTDTKVTQSLTTSNSTNLRPILVGYTSHSSDISNFAEATNQVYAIHNIYVKPSTGTLYATNFIGNADRLDYCYATGAGASGGWWKIATCKMTSTATDTAGLTLFFTSQYYKGSGIIEVDLRKEANASTYSASQTTLRLLSRDSSVNPEHFKLVITSTSTTNIVADLYYYQSAPWGHKRFTKLDEGGFSAKTTNKWTLISTSGAGGSLPTESSTVKIIDCVDDSYAANISDISAAKITSGTLPIARGGTNAATALDAITNLGGLSISSQGVQIPSNSTIGNYKTPGRYFVTGSEVTTTLTDKASLPFTTSGFQLTVTQGYRAATLYQYITGIGSSGIYRRYSDNTGSSWSSWQKFAFTSDLDDYLPLSGGTISNTNFAPLTIDRSNGAYSAGIAFKNTNGILGYVGMMGSADGALIRYKGSNPNTYYSILDTGNYTTTLDTRYVKQADVGNIVGLFTGSCSSAAGAQAKVATVGNNFSLVDGVTVAIKFTNTNTYTATAASPVTLNVNNTGAKQIYYAASSTNAGTLAGVYGYADRYITYMYDATNDVWVYVSHGYDSDTNTQIRVYRQTSGYNADYPLLVSRTATIGTAGTNSSYSAVYGVVYDSNQPTLNPSTGLMKVHALSVDNEIMLNGDNTATIKVPETMVGNLNYTLPSSSGTLVVLNTLPYYCSMLRNYFQLVPQSGGDLNNITTAGHYEVKANTEASGWTHRPVSNAVPFSLQVARYTRGYYSDTGVRQIYREADSFEVYERYSQNSGSSWTEWKKVQTGLSGNDF